MVVLEHDFLGVVLERGGVGVAGCVLVLVRNINGPYCLELCNTYTPSFPIQEKDPRGISE